MQSVEDDRPLEDLLRDLGEVDLGKKVKKKAPKKAPKVAPKAPEIVREAPVEVNEELEEEEEEEASKGLLRVSSKGISRRFA